MIIEDKIKNIDCQLFAIKLTINSNYGVSFNEFDIAYKTRYNLKLKKRNLLKQKERKQKLEKINESILY